MHLYANVYGMIKSDMNYYFYFDNKESDLNFELSENNEIFLNFRSLKKSNTVFNLY